MNDSANDQYRPTYYRRRHFLKTGLVGTGVAAGALAHPGTAVASSGRGTRQQSGPPPTVYPLVPFSKYSGNQILSGDSAHRWESDYVFNPAAVVRNESVYLLYRAQGSDLVSSIGLAWSHDGINFSRLRNPVIEPTESYESHGCEDPRIVKIGNTYYLTYTGYDGDHALLCMATSQNIINWTKHGPLFPDFETPKRGKAWSKSGAILTTPINNRYIMYFGDSDIYYAWSSDLLHWTPGPNDRPVVSRDPDTFSENLVEPGPPPLITRNGDILFMYNASRPVNDKDAPSGEYSTGQILISPRDPTRVANRMPHPFLEPTTKAELHGQVADVVFAEGFVKFRGKYYLYYGMADSHVGVATYRGRSH